MASPAAAVNEDKPKQPDAVIAAERRITTAKQNFQVSHSSAYSLVQSIGYTKTCTKWVLRMLTDSMKE